MTTRLWCYALLALIVNAGLIAVSPQSGMYFRETRLRSDSAIAESLLQAQERLGEFHGTDLFTVPGRLEGFRGLVQATPFSKHFDGICAYIRHNNSIVPLDIQIARLNQTSVPCPRGPVADVRFNPEHFYEFTAGGSNNFVKLAGIRKSRNIPLPVPKDWPWRVLAALFTTLQIALLIEVVLEITHSRTTLTGMLFGKGRASLTPKKAGAAVLCTSLAALLFGTLPLVLTLDNELMSGFSWPLSVPFALVGVALSVILANLGPLGFTLVYRRLLNGQPNKTERVRSFFYTINGFAILISWAIVAFHMMLLAAVNC